jgi:medium-chain acyl-[acyl-carrier-protein] hydrolase
LSPEIINEYSRSLNVPVYDVGPTNTLKFGSALRLVQETSEQHLNVMHAGYETMKKTAGLVFFIISTRVHIFHFPGNGEPITIKTHPRGRGGAQLYRDFKFYDAKGDLLLDVMQTTVLADAVTHKVQRPQALKQFGFYPEDIVEPENRMERFSVPDGLPLLGVRRVFYSDLDANGHMNNSVYGDIVWDFLPRMCAGRRIQFRLITSVKSMRAKIWKFQAKKLAENSFFAATATAAFGLQLQQKAEKRIIRGWH